MIKSYHCHNRGVGSCYILDLQYAYYDNAQMINALFVNLVEHYTI